MSVPIDQPQQLLSPPTSVYEQSYTSHGGGGGSVGPVIGVLAVVAVLGIVAGIVGRICSRRTILGYGHYDLEGWIERKCASCIDGRIEPPVAPATTPAASANGGGNEHAAVSVETPPENKPP